VGLHPWSRFTMQDHPREPEHSPSAGLSFPGHNREPRTAGQQPCSSHSQKLTSLHTAEAWGVNSSTGQMGCFAHWLSHYNALSPLVCVCCYSSHPSLCHMLDRNHPHWLDSQWKVFICSILTYVCILLRQGELLLRLYFSILTIPVQALSSGHALTITPTI
jgi:hypothetical protein